MPKALYKHSLEIESEAHARALAELKARYPRLANDEDWTEDDRRTIADTLEGLTDFGEAVDAVVRSIQDDEAWAKEVIPAQIRKLQARKERMLDRAKGNREKLQNVLTTAILSMSERSYRRPGYTLTVPQEKRVINVIDPDMLPPSLTMAQNPEIDFEAVTMDAAAGMLPERYLKPRPPAPDMNAIAKLIDARQPVEGIEITYTSPSLQIR